MEIEGNQRIVFSKNWLSIVWDLKKEYENLKISEKSSSFSVWCNNMIKKIREKKLKKNMEKQNKFYFSGNIFNGSLI